MAVKSKARHDLTLRSIKREIHAGRDVAFWLDKAYAHLDSGLFDEADIEEVEELAAAYYDGLDSVEQPGDDVSAGIVGEEQTGNTADTSDSATAVCGGE